MLIYILNYAIRQCTVSCNQHTPTAHYTALYCMTYVHRWKMNIIIM